MPYGTITRLVPEHGFGFIVDDAGMDWFFVLTGIRGSTFEDVWVNERVGFSAEWTPQGPRAVDVRYWQLD